MANDDYQTYTYLGDALGHAVYAYVGRGRPCPTREMLRALTAVHGGLEAFEKNNWNGVCCQTERIILLDAHLPRAALRRVLAHELGHALLGAAAGQALSSAVGGSAMLAIIHEVFAEGAVPYVWGHRDYQALLARLDLAAEAAFKNWSARHPGPAMAEAT